MTSSERRQVLRPALLALGLGLVVSNAHAQRSPAEIESARQAYNDGMALRDRGDLKGALEKFRAAHALGNTPITGLELCKTHAALGQPVEAREACLGVGRIPPLAGETPRSQEARSEAARVAEEVKPRISAIRIKVLGVPAGREPTVVVDGAPVPAAALGQPRSMNPGPHVVTARVGSGVETRATFDMREGEARDVEMTVAPPPAEEPAAAPPPARYEDRPKPEKKTSGLATVGFGIAIAGGAIGVITGAVALSKKSDLDDACIDKGCGRELHGELDSARSWAGISTASFILGGVGAGLGLIGLASSGSSNNTGARVTPVIGLGGAGVHGSF